MKLEGLAGRVAVVTGAGGFIGHAVCARLAAEGVHVAAVDIEPAGLERLQTVRGSIKAFDVDVANGAEVNSLADKVLTSFGGVDFLLNVAGGELRPTRAYPDAEPRRGLQPIDQVEETLWARTLSINLRSAYLCCRVFVPHLKARGGGRIVNFASAAGISTTLRTASRTSAATLRRDRAATLRNASSSSFRR